MVSKTVSIVGLSVSVVLLLALAISLNWAGFHFDEEVVVVQNYVNIPNRVQAPQALTNETVDKWGTIPGKFDSTYQTSVSIDQYTAEFLSVDHISKTLKKHREGNSDSKMLWSEMMSEVKLGSNNYNISKESNLEILQSSGSDITYRPNNTFDTTDIPLHNTVITVNYDALSLWWQMENLPVYLRGWQALSQINNKFNEQNFLSFYYAN